MRSVALRTLLGVSISVAALAASEPSVRIPAVDPGRYLEHVKFLSSDDLQGRGNGYPGLERAADYIGRRFRATGLAPGGAGASYFQPFELVAGVEVHAGNQLTIRSDRRSAALSLGEYYPLSLSPTATVTDALYATMDLPLVFVGHGVVAPSLGYDDYAGVNVTGKAVLAFTHEPGPRHGGLRYAGANPEFGSAARKAVAAQERGARLLILVDDAQHEAEPREYRHFAAAPTVEDLGIAVVRARRDNVAAALAGVLDLSAAARDIERTERPRSRALDAEIRLVERYTRVRARVRNVIGVLRGSDPQIAHQAIVVGAHYDHVGFGGPHSLASGDKGEVHNGADDNASGTAALLEMAYVAAREGGFGRTVVFVAFAGEEIGLLGSSFYVSHPAVPLDRTTAMINLDMVGRPAGRIMVTGLDEPLVSPGDVEALRAVTTLELRRTTEGYGSGSSDDSSFHDRHVPTVCFFSGFHEDYHRPTDDWQRVDAGGGAEVAKIALTLVRRLATGGHTSGSRGTRRKVEEVVTTPASYLAR